MLFHTDGTQRRDFLRSAAIGGGLLAIPAIRAPRCHGDESEVQAESRQATGVRVGEVTDRSAIVWVRLTKHSERHRQSVTSDSDADVNKKSRRPVAAEVATTEAVDVMEGACPGAAGRVRVRYGVRPNLDDSQVTNWAEVSDRTDFIHQFALRDLRPATVYYYASETTGPQGRPAHAALHGKFTTAPANDSTETVRFCVMTCQGYPDRGHADGHGIYPSMSACEPHFACLTGDLVYYDNDAPRAVTPRLARYHWERMFSLPRLREFTRNVATYWLKDDHDTLSNDSWAGKKQGELTFAEGQRIFRQQAPLSEGPSYRTFRWGRDLQVWFTDGRDFRSPNNQPDGPNKSIWGADQKEWFKRTIRESDATWKILVSPTPLVGPDRKGKNDNHSNAGFRHEGDEIRAWLQENSPHNFFVICGDRHWQYHSVHPVTGLHEFSVGPASDAHAGGTPGQDPAVHRFHRVKGGFLAVTVSRPDDKPRITFELRNVDGQVVYSHAAVSRTDA